MKLPFVSRKDLEKAHKDDSYWNEKFYSADKELNALKKQLNPPKPKTYVVYRSNGTIARVKGFGHIADGYSEVYGKSFFTELRIHDADGSEVARFTNPISWEIGQ